MVSRRRIPLLRHKHIRPIQHLAGPKQRRLARPTDSLRRAKHARRPLPRRPTPPIRTRRTGQREAQPLPTQPRRLHRQEPHPDRQDRLQGHEMVPRRKITHLRSRARIAGCLSDLADGPETGTVKKIVTNEAGDCEYLEYSPDGKKIAYSTTRNYQYTGVRVKDLDAGTEIVLAPIDDKSTTIVQGWTRDSKKVYVTSNANRQGIEAVSLLELRENPEFKWLTLGEWDTQLVAVSDAEDKFAYIVNRAGNLRLLLRDLNGEEEEIPPAQGVVRAARFSPDGKRLAIIHAQGDSPHDIWVYDIKARTLKQITSSLVGGLHQDNFVNPHLVVYPSYAETPIASFLYIPANIKQDNSHPAIIYPHGGPQWEHFNSWYPRLQYFVSHGYVVMAPNFRGSTGFGREFTESLRKDCGGGDLKDLVAATEYLNRTGYVDPDRIAIMGCSWGGYLTLIALTKTPEIWAAGVSIVPLANWFTAHENEDPVLQKNDEWLMGDPVTDRELWRDRSPIFFADKIRAPLLLLAGKNDIRCPVEETMQMAEAARKNGVTVEVKVYEDEGHGFVRRENEIDSIKRSAKFLETHVGAR